MQKFQFMKLAKLNNRAEIFHTIQGEGKSIGKPSIFVRTSLCNLHCIWCDTDYTWNWKGTSFKHIHDSLPGYSKFSKEEYLIELPIEGIVKEVQGINCKNIVLTGGEPLLQQDDLQQLMATLKRQDNNYRFEVETNGTLIPSDKFNQYVEQYNVSPKLQNSNNSLKLRARENALHYFAQNDKAVFKFVLTNPDDLDEILGLIEKYQIKPETVYLMPEGQTEEKLRLKQQWLIEVCKQYNFNYTDRIHIHIYGSKRGV